jgi:FixJ family two-component response regulator
MTSTQRKDGREADVRQLICVVDDDPSISRMLTRVITTLEFDVEEFTSAEELLQSGRIRDAACVILDVDLPGMSGIELQQKLSNDPEAVPVILISGRTDEPMRERALGKGAAAFFKKPFKIDSILRTIQAFTSLQNLRLRPSFSR